MSMSTSVRGRVLIVDDDRRILDLLVDLLEMDGYEVLTAPDGAEAIELALSFNPDVIISDVVMPVVGGLELCRRLKQEPGTANVPVLLISGLIRSDEAGIEGLNAGADDYLDLPFRNEELLAKVARLVERHRIQEVLKESEERYRSLVELSPDAIVVHREGKFLYVNPAAVKLWGASTAQDLIGKSILCVVHPDYHDHVMERVDYIQQFQRPTELAEQKCLRLDGIEVDVEVTGLPFTSALFGLQASGSPSMRRLSGRAEATREAALAISVVSMGDTL
jgi:PAS domain S-box-containing protein